MLPQQNMDMIGHDCTGIAGITLFCQGMGDTFRYEVDFLQHERNDWIFQHRDRLFVKLLDYPARWLNLAASVVQFAQLRKGITRNRIRAAATRIIKPAAVRGPNKEMGDDDGLRQQDISKPHNC